MAREIVLEDDSNVYAERRDWHQRKVVFLGVKGAPDRWYFKQGVLLIVEFKKRGEPLSPHQVRRHRELRAAGFEVHVIDRFEDFVALIDRTDAEIARVSR